ncbi:MAG: diaminopimelate epimerase [Actinobacteria bacterium]|nr:diaminopimelate epimerase [Actinomycetota bacterium]
MRFTKMEGAGNDYVYINDLAGRIADPNAFSARISDRHFGIGSDGLIIARPSEHADFFMRMYNADGSEGKMCGNGIRCFTKFLLDEGLLQANIARIETLSGIKTTEVLENEPSHASIRVNMGVPILDCASIPVTSPLEHMINEPLTVDGICYNITAVSMGNPHCVVFIDDDPRMFPLEQIGPLFETHSIFPERVNTEFVQVIDRENIMMRVWERGSGETLACGTGACASAVAAILNGLTERAVKVHLLGGVLEIEWDKETGELSMTGPATNVFIGEIALLPNEGE